jgi:hypothetical protein
MGLKKLGAVVVAVLAVGGLFASVALAQQWCVNGVKLASGSSLAATAKTTSTIVLVSKLFGSSLKLTATGLEAKEGKIVQTGSGTSGVSTLTGKLVFTGIIVDEPEGCKSPGTIETTALVGTARMGITEATKENVYVKVVPKEGEVFTTFKITECAAAGSYQIKGSVFVKANNPTGTAAVTQGGTTSGAINSSQGGALTLGKEAATLDGTIDITLASGAPWALTAE